MVRNSLPFAVIGVSFRPVHSVAGSSSVENPATVTGSIETLTGSVPDTNWPLVWCHVMVTSEMNGEPEVVSGERKNAGVEGIQRQRRRRRAELQTLVLAVALRDANACRSRIAKRPCHRTGRLYRNRSGEKRRAGLIRAVENKARRAASKRVRRSRSCCRAVFSAAVTVPIIAGDSDKVTVGPSCAGVPSGFFTVTMMVVYEFVLIDEAAGETVTEIAGAPPNAELLPPPPPPQLRQQRARKQ